MPVCPHCQQDRSIRDYYFVEAKGRRYRRRKCKPCHQQTAQAWKRANAERVAAYNREYYFENADAICLKARRRAVVKALAKVLKA